MARARKKKYLEISVHEMSLQRIEYLYSRFDNIVVNFSGGKDSTTVLNCCIEVAKKLGKLPVNANFFDEEAIHPPTIEYVHRVFNNPDVDLKWYALPFKHRNACSNEQPFWYCWNPEEEELWTRPMPKEAITVHPKFKFGMSFQEFSSLLPDEKDGMTCIMTGVRTQESFRRMKAVSTKKNDNYLSIVGHVGHAHPVYDWSSEDVWFAAHKFKWDYNKTYDILNQTRFNGRFLAQRVCPPFGEEPLRGLWLYSECFPEMWHKMLARVPGVATAWRYANTDLYGFGKLEKPERMKTYKDWAAVILDSYTPEIKQVVSKNLNTVIRKHYTKTDDVLPETDVHPLTGTSWSLICQLCIKGDLKGRTAPKLENKAIDAQKKLGIHSFDEAIKRFGNYKYKKKKGLL